ncbi:hypothetical protein ACF0H5_004197 [Mactra antiquata]
MLFIRCLRLCKATNGLKNVNFRKTSDFLQSFNLAKNLPRLFSTSSCNIETIVERSCESIGEGPHWDERTQSLLYVDIHDGVVHRWSSLTGQNESHRFSAFCSLIIPCESGGYIVSNKKTICHFDWDSKRLTAIDKVDDTKATRINDGKCDASGRLWFGTMGLEKSPAVVRENQGSLYSLERDGSVKLHKEGVSISNGLAWTADNKTMYYIDSIPRKVYAFDFDLNNGSISNERVAINFGGEDTMTKLGYPDGMAIDTDDNIWIACYSVGRVVKFNPKTGEELDSVSVPALRTTSCCFGGKYFDELFITCSRYGLTENEKKETPLAGSIFRVKGLGVKGTPAPVYKGSI